jgi:diacylglycerol kinase family enzyme
MAQVVRALSTGPTSPIDILTVNARYGFVNYCSVGFDAQISCAYARLRRHPMLQTRLQGRVINECAYTLLALRYVGCRLPGLHCQLRMQDADWTTVDMRPGASALIVSNLSSYGGGALLAGNVSFDDGLFEVTQISRPWIFLLLMASRAWPRLRQACCLESWQARELRVPLPLTSALQVDGEDSRELLAGGAGLSVQVAGQIQVVVPDVGIRGPSTRSV